MTTNKATCPPPYLLRDFGLGKLDAASADTVGQHLETCVDCSERVANLSRDTFVDRLRVAGGSRAEDPAPKLSSSLEPTEAWQAEAPQDKAPEMVRQVATPPELTNHPDYDGFKRVGRGGMGVVYLARNRTMDRFEVLKVVNQALLKLPGAVERFQQEIRSAARLRHPNIVAAYTVFRTGGLLVFAMEYVRGDDLSRVVKQRGPLPVANASYYAYQAALGLQHALDKGMVHRDIKPSNLMLTIEGKKHVVKILDFGLAKATSENPADAGLTKSGQMLGTPDYISPEQILDAQKADIRADIYSLGCTLYFLLSGKPPFDEPSLYELLQAHQSRNATPLDQVRADISAELAAVAAKMMAKDPSDRYQRPIDVAKALGPFFKAKPAQAKGEALQAAGAPASRHNLGRPTAQPVITLTPPKPQRVAHRFRGWMSRRTVAAGAAALSVVLVALLVLTRNRRPNDVQDDAALGSAPVAASSGPAMGREFEDRPIFGSIENRPTVETLAQPVKKGWDGITLSELCRDLRDDYQMNVFFDERALFDMGLNGNVKLASWNARRGSLNQALSAMLAPLGIIWTVQRNTLWISTAAPSLALPLELAAYRISDAVDAADAGSFVKSIEQVKPATWDLVGGRGALKPGDRVLFVLQTPETQREIETRFSKYLRRIEPAVTMFPKSDAVRGALQSKVDLAFDGAPLGAVLEAVGKGHGLEIEIKARALTDAGMDTNSPVTIHTRQQPLEIALELVLRPLNLQYFVDEDVVFITTAADAENELRPIEYDASDAVRLFGDIDSVVKAIESLVWPNTWSQVGGPGEILTLPDHSTLSIDQMYAVHVDLHQFFALVSAAAGDTDGIAASRQASQAGTRISPEPVFYGPPESRDIVKALASPIKRIWVNATLDEFINDLRDDYRIQAIIDTNDIQGNGIDPPSTQFINWRARRCSLEVALTAVLRSVDLTWTIHKGNLWIISKNKKDSDRSLQDLAAYRTGPAISMAAEKSFLASGRAKTMLGTKSFIAKVQRVEKASWDVYGGSGSLALGNGVLFVRHAPEMEREIERRFHDDLRRVAPAPIEFPKSELVRTALKAKTAFSFRERSLASALNYVAEAHGLEIEMKTRALAEAGFSADSPITCELEGQPLGVALDVLLRPRGLRYFVDGDVMFVTSATDAKQTLRAIEYDARDAVRLFGDMDSLIKAIESLVRPWTWNRVGGHGQLVPLPGGTKLSIDQSYGAHGDLHEFFALVRAAASDL